MRYFYLFIFSLLCLTVNAQKNYIYDDYEKERTIPIQLRTNGLYWCALFPNIGIEAQTNYGLAFQLDYTGAWWNKDRTHHYYSGYAFQFETRYYFKDANKTKIGESQKTHVFSGSHVGLYIQMITYDFEFGNKGYQCNDLSKTIGIGASYGYCMPLNKTFSLDFTIGIGYLHTNYTEYIPHSDKYVRTGEKSKTWIGPTKAEISLVWNINNKNKE